MAPLDCREGECSQLGDEGAIWARCGMYRADTLQGHFTWNAFFEHEVINDDRDRARDGLAQWTRTHDEASPNALSMNSHDLAP